MLTAFSLVTAAISRCIFEIELLTGSRRGLSINPIAESCVRQVRAEDVNADACRESNNSREINKEDARSPSGAGTQKRDGIVHNNSSQAYARSGETTIVLGLINLVFWIRSVLLPYLSRSE